MTSQMGENHLRAKALGKENAGANTRGEIDRYTPNSNN